ncbi:hypothetical protein VTI74DRAFT_4062 [Chaetomium olivicolor]
MRRPAQHLPQKPHPPPPPGHRRRDVRRGVAHADGEDGVVRRHGQQARAEREDALAVGRAALGEDGDDAVGVLRDQRAEVGEPPPPAGAFFEFLQRGELGLRGQGGADGGEEPDAPDLAGGRVAGDEDRVEDGREVERVERGGKVGGDDGSWVGHARAGLGGEGAALDAVQLQVHPPYTGDGEEQPEEEFAGDGGEGEVMQQEEVDRTVGEEERETEEEEHAVEEGRG